MKYSNELLFISMLTTIFCGQSIEIPDKLMHRNEIRNVPIFIYDVIDLEGLTMKLTYDKNIILVEDLITDPFDLLGSGYSFISNIDTGSISITIFAHGQELFSGNGMVAKISLKSVGQLGEISALTIIDSQISGGGSIEKVHGSVEIILDELLLTGVDEDGEGIPSSITMGTCETCTDGWKSGEDEEALPNPPNSYTNIHFPHHEWVGQEDINGNINSAIKFATDLRKPRSSSQLMSWGIAGSTNLSSSDIPININWDSSKLDSTSENFNIFIYVGDNDGIDMQLQDSIVISQSYLEIDENDVPKIWVKLGACAETGAVQYYFDSDGDGLGSDQSDEFCINHVPEGWVTNFSDLNDEIFCESNEVDCLDVLCGLAVEDPCGICNGDLTCLDCNGNPNGSAVLDCFGVCGGNAIVDECGECGGLQFDGDFDEDGEICETECLENLDCNGQCGGSAELDECGVCGGDGIDEGACDCNGNVEDCAGECGGSAELDECGVCGGDGIDEGACDCNGNVEDCAGECGGSAELDECSICDNDPSNDCVQDCLGVWGGMAQRDECDVCDIDINNDNLCLDCAGIPNGGSIVDNCSICDNDPSNDCVQDCLGVWGGMVQPDECVCDDPVLTDNCGTCDDDPSNDCVQDCLGVWGGMAQSDQCDVCDVDMENDNLCLDCSGVVDGDAYTDNCGSCIEIGEEDDFECSMDCDGIWGGTHIPTFGCPDGTLQCSSSSCATIEDTSEVNMNIGEDYFPRRFDINRIYPNPFNPQTTIEYQVLEPVNMKLVIYNVVGQRIYELKNEYVLPGYYAVNWNGSFHPSGIYFVILYSHQSIIRKKIILLK